MLKNEDGIDHINIYSKGHTELGKALSNFSYYPIKISDGTFNSLEGYWYWLLSDKGIKAEPLRKLYGWQAKEYGRKIKIRDWPYKSESEKFQIKFKEAMEAKLIQHPELISMLIEVNLPFKHYYVYDGKIINVNRCEWMLEHWENLRKKYSNEQA